MTAFSILDLAPVPEGETVRSALLNTLDLARHAEGWGYHRYWLAEHHNMSGIASAATAVLIGQVAAATKTMRVGSGGIMLPNHAPLMVAEAFGTLATLFPDRIDLGLGRAPGTDMATARALRRHLASGDDFPRDVQELIGYLGDEPGAGGEPGAGRVRAFPGTGTHVPVWILGSSLFGAQLAAYLGLPYAFASHFAPAALEQALGHYRSAFRPSVHLAAPRFMLAVNAFAAPTDAAAEVLKSSVMQAFVNLRTGKPGPLPKPVTDIEAVLEPGALAMVRQALSCSVTGAEVTVRREMAALLERYRPDEVILTGQIHDHAARLRSFEIMAGVMRALA
ncbi:MAG: LLM class flavin-dependent oxidoreductase [Paracoccaceae bacterium]